MADENNLTAEEAYAIADSLAQTSARLLALRSAPSKPLSDADASALERCEDTLDQLVVVIRGQGMRLIGAKAQEAMHELQAAVNSAEITIAQSKQVKEAIKLATTLVDLAKAVLANDPLAIIGAAIHVKAASKQVKTPGNRV